MTTPNVTIQKATFATVQAPPSTVGVLAILAGSSTGTVGVPSGFARSNLAVQQFGYGVLTEAASYLLAFANNPVVLCKLTTTNAGTYTGLNVTGVLGTSVVTTSGAPFDHYVMSVTVVNGGTVGTPGITYTWSPDNGNIVNGAVALGSATTITLPNT